MKEIIKRICSLINAGTMISFAVIGTYCYLAIKGTITPESVKEATVIILTFFFSSKIGAKASSGKEENNEKDI